MRTRFLLHACSIAALGCLGACDDEENTRAAVDGGLLSCQEGDSEFARLLSTDVELRQLRSCTRDQDCVLWQPLFECRGETIRNCAQATAAVNVDATYRRRDDLAAAVCTRLGEPCRVGVTCPSDVGARCLQGSCTVVAEAGVQDPTDAGAPCYSPLQPPSRGQSTRGGLRGCGCTNTAATSYCVNGHAVTCYSSATWEFGADGYCWTTSPDPVGSCAQIKGTLIEAGTCPSGFATRKPYLGPSDAGAGETGTCCYPIDVTKQNCVQAGLEVVASGSQRDLLGTRCSNEGELRGFVVDQSSPSLCCTP